MANYYYHQKVSINFAACHLAVADDLPVGSKVFIKQPLEGNAKNLLRVYKTIAENRLFVFWLGQWRTGEAMLFRSDYPLSEMSGVDLETLRDYWRLAPVKGVLADRSELEVAF